MVLEVVDIRIPEGRQSEFEEALKLGVENAISKSPGYLSYRLQHCIETPERYLVLIQWRTLEDHTVTFRESELFPKWRGYVGEFFAVPPHVEHFEEVAAG